MQTNTALYYYEKNSSSSLQNTLKSFREFVQLRDNAPRTVNAYLSHIRMLAEHFEADPTSLNEAQVRDYFVFLRQEKQYKPSTMNQAKVALRTFYRDHLGITPRWRVFRDVKVKHRETLPNVIAKEDVRLLLSKVSEPRFKACLSLIYTCGLRLSEGINVNVSDIDAKLGRLLVPQGKGRKPRYVPISQEMIAQLRLWWKWHRHPKFLFPAVGRRWRKSQRGNALTEERMRQEAMRAATKPMSGSTVQNALKWAIAAAGLKQRVTVHTLRHCYATHLLEDGVSIRHISAYLGHASLDQTVVYAHLTAVSEERTQAVLSALHQDVVQGQASKHPRKD